MVNTLRIYEVRDLDNNFQAYYFNFRGLAEDKKKLIDKQNEIAERLNHGALITKLSVTANGYSVAKFANDLIARLAYNKEKVVENG